MEPENLCSDGNDETDEAIVDEHLTCPTILYNEENVMNEENEVGICGSLEGLKRKTLDEMYELYAQHSRALGFSICKSTTRMKNNRIVEKYFVCSFEGTRKAKNPQGTSKSKNLDNQSEVSSSKGKRKNITRTGCEASMRVRLNDEDVYEVAHHITSHNHPLTRKEWVHLHRSEREIISEKAQAIETMISSGMRAVDSFCYMVQEAGGEQSVGHTMKDHKSSPPQDNLPLINSSSFEIDVLFSSPYCSFNSAIISAVSLCFNVKTG
nr:protein FAR1-RELATED SEQUENCE 5-like [Ipomoea batatas]